MGSVLIHAGMPKTGSTSIQFWLRENVELLRARGTHVVIDACGPGGTDYRFELLGEAPITTSNMFLVRYAAAMQRAADVAERSQLADEFATSLGSAVDQFGDVVLSSEGFATLIQQFELPFLDALDALGRRHRVTVAYYVRPQDTALEARWREWGFRSGRRPADWLAEESRDLHYFEAYSAVLSQRPSFAFEVRPFRPDALEGHSTVVDFTRRFLGVEDPPAIKTMNLGLSLDFVNLLRIAPPELLDPPSRPDGSGWRQGELGPISRRWSIEESAEARASRAVLRDFALLEFEQSNRELAELLGWPVSFLVDDTPDVPGLGGDPLELLEEVDRLWTPDASPTVLAHLFAALGELWPSGVSR